MTRQQVMGLFNVWNYDAKSIGKDQSLATSIKVIPHIVKLNLYFYIFVVLCIETNLLIKKYFLLLGIRLNRN